MTQINIHEAKTHLSRWVGAIESGAETEIVIARAGVPAARLMPMPQRRPVIIGIAAGKFDVPDDIDALNPEIASMFYGDES